MRSRVRERRTHGSVRGLRREPLVYSTPGVFCPVIFTNTLSYPHLHSPSKSTILF